MGLFERKESVVDNDISVEEDLSDLDELVDEPVFGPEPEDDFESDNAFRIRVAKSAECLGEAYVAYARHYIELLKCEEFLKFALSTSVFEDGEIGYIVNDHITLSFKLERS